MDESLVDNIIQSPNLRSYIQSCIRDQCNSSGRASGEDDIRGSTTATTVLNPRCNNVNTPFQLRQELRTLFPSTSRSASRSATSSKPKNKGKAKNFYVDVILLESPTQKKTLIGKKKAEAFENGHAISSVDFMKDWDELCVKEHLTKTFETLLVGSEFEVLVPVGGYLVKPNLSENQTLDGLNLFKLFYKKAVYLRVMQEASMEISDSEVNEFHEEENGTENVYPFCSLDLDIIDPKSLKEILSEIRNHINEDTCTMFNIFREDIYNGCLRAINRKNFSPFNKITVSFTDLDNNSEGAIDAGGPTREMFRLLLEHLKNSRIFCGSQNEKYINLNKDALHNNQYYECGRLIAMSIVHAGIGPNFFSDFLFKQIVMSETLDPSIEDIADNDIKSELNLAMNSEDINSLRNVVIDGIYFKLAGWESIFDFTNKAKMIQDACKFYTVDRVKECIIQLTEGFKLMGLYQKMQRYPEYFVESMCYNNNQVLDVSTLESLFKIDYSEQGSNNRRQENKTMAFWKDYLIDCYENDSEDYCKLEEVLCFCTGSNSVPVFGFPYALTISFLHDNIPYPKGNTCGLVLHLPTVHNTFEEFKSNFTFGVKNGMVFGLV